MIDFKKFNHHCAIIQMLSSFFFTKQKCLMIIFAKSELTIASQTLATTITVGSMCPGAKVAPSAFLSFLID